MEDNNLDISHTITINQINQINQINHTNRTDIDNIYVMYIFINSDLSMSKGQIAAQCCHITQLITEDLVKKSYEMYPAPSECFDYMKWKNNPTTIILKANTEQLNSIKNLTNHPNLSNISNLPNPVCFYDSGNRISEPSLTAVGLYPSSNYHDMVKNYKLF